MPDDENRTTAGDDQERPGVTPDKDGNDTAEKPTQTAGADEVPDELSETRLT